MMRGRKVTNPTVTSGGGSKRNDENKDLNKAWNNIHKVKTELRRIEHRLGETDYKTVLHLNEVWETSITEYSPVEDLTYEALDPNRGAFVDRYGRTNYLRTKSTNRKVSRLEDKYHSMDTGARSRTERSDGKGNLHGRPERSKVAADMMANGGHDTKFKSSRNTRENSPKHVDFTEQLELRGTNPGDGSFGEKGASGGVTSDTNSFERYPSDITQNSLTDSRAIRETDVRFLNNDLSRYNECDVRWGRPIRPSPNLQNHMTHVNVNVPNSRNVHPLRNAESGTTHTRQGLSHEDIAAERNRQWEVGSTDSARSDSSSQITRKLKKTLKDLDFDALSKIKEKIRRQQQKSSPRENQHNDIESAENEPCNGPHHLLHNDHEPVLSRASYNLPPPDGAAEGHKKIRKIAAGPATPSYKGFSETEVKYKYTDFKPPKVMDWRKKEKKKKAALKLQEKKLEQAAREIVPEEKSKPKKMTRVVASNKKLDKQPKKDIITTSSWRAGQELILRELGPIKTRKTSQSSETSEHRPMGASGGDYDNIEVHEEHLEYKEPKSSTAMELERAKALSEEARKVLSDLNMGSDNEQEDFESKGKENKDNRRRRSGKRKAPRSSEPEKQSNAKQRHYDPDEVRKFIQKQKADRIRQQKEEEKRQQQAVETRKQQLEELRNKQKQSAQHSKKPQKPSRYKNKPHDETFSHPMNYKDLPRHHPFHEDHPRGSLATSESERERHQGIHRDEDEMELSDGSSTLTGESVDELTPTSTPRIEGSEKSKPKANPQRSNILDGNLKPDSAANSNFKSIGGLTFDMDGVMSKFSEALHNQGTDINSGYGGSMSSLGSQDRPQVYGSELPNNHGRVEAYGSEQPPRSRADRIQAIKDTAATLQRKIQVESSKITGQNPDLQGRWALSSRLDPDEDNFLTRYDRITGAEQDFSVFSSNLPGQQRIHRDQRPVEEHTIETAAVRIQAAYRGHSVRQSLNWKLPSGNTVRTSHRKDLHHHDDDSSITETSTFSEITITEDSENDSDVSPNRKVGTGLRERDFHAGSSNRNHPLAEEFVIPHPTHSSQPNRYSWENPSPDPFSVLNIFARHQKNQEKSRPISSSREIQQRTSVKEASFRPEQIKSQNTVPSKSSIVTSNLRTQSPSGGPGASVVKSSAVPVRSESPQAVSGSQKSAYKSRSEVTHPKFSSSFKSVENDQQDRDESTIEADSYTQSFESEDEKPSGKVSIALSEKSSIKVQFKPHSTREAPLMDLSVMEDNQSLSMGRISPPGEESESIKAPPRLSPNSLERQFYLEFNQLESMEESMRQLTGMERTRAVSMAQQESVSLAQMLKARQQAHERDMKLLENKAQQEALAAVNELQSARLRGSAANQSAEETLSRIRRAPMRESSDNIRPRKASKQSLTQTPDSARTMTPSYTQPSSYTTSNTRTPTRSPVDSVKTASDTQRGAESDSSIHSLSQAKGHDDSAKDDSISEELDDYTLDETEDELDRSFRSILPSESHRKRAKKQLDNVSVTSDEGSISAPSTPRYSLDDLGSFLGEDSFNKFTEEMVRQFMREEELRAQHQASLLQLREKALMEKTKAELSWLDQQKQRIRNKGADDSYPQIVKRQRGLKMRLQEQQAEIKRLQEQNKAASRERQMILQQHEEISRLRQQTQKTVEKMKPGRLEGRLGRPSEVHTEDEVSAFDEHSDAGSETKLKKDYKSDSEIYTEVKGGSKKGKSDNMAKMKKIHLDEKYLTVREQKLHDRRKNAEDLLKWKKRLDEEEARIYKMEQKAIKVWDGGSNKKESSHPVKPDIQKSKTGSTVSRKDKKESQTYSSVQEDTFVSEVISTAKDESLKKSTVTETPRTEISASESSPEERKRVGTEKSSKNKTLGRSASESSIPEEVQSQSSAEDLSPETPNRKTKTSAADNTLVNDSYADNTFEESTVATSRDKTSRKSPRSPLDKLSKQRIDFPLTGRDFKPRRHGNRGRSSESESEESISHTDVSTYTETQSDLSDFEGRVRALSEELKRRKIQADKLKKERKKRKKEILKNKEEALKKQIEAYDNQIVQLKTEIQSTIEHEPVKSSVKPQILKPRVSPVKSKIASPVVDTEDLSGTDSTQSSPSVIDDKDSKPNSPVSKSTPVSSRIPVTLDKISEGSESSRSRTGSLRSLKRKDDSSVTEDIVEADDSSYSGYLKNTNSLVVSEKQTLRDDESYSQDFERTGTASIAPPDKNIQSARSVYSESREHKPSLSEHITDQISEVYSEKFDSVRSESFVKPLDLQKGQDVFDEQISPRSNSTISISRPSSEKSERSYSSKNSDLDVSDSDHASSASAVQPEQQQKEESVANSVTESIVIDNDLGQNSEDESERYPVFKSEDIPKLEIVSKGAEEEEETPINSPRDEEEPSQIDDPLSDFKIGDRVMVTGLNRSRKAGHLLYKGKVHFAPGIWAGVELDQAEGKSDGAEGGKRYFSCKSNHGIFVPGNDLMPAPVPTPRSPAQGSIGNITSPDESFEEQEASDHDLSKLIDDADVKVQQFGDEKRKDEIADKVTEQILEQVVREDLNTITEISDRKTPPPVAPKPKRSVEDSQKDSVLMNGHLSSTDESGKSSPIQKKAEMANKVVNNLLDDALSKMITIRNKNRSRNEPVSAQGDLMSFDLPMSPTDELQRVLNKEEDEETGDKFEVPPRPSSPMPGSMPKSNQSVNQLNKDIDALFDNEYIDDDLWGSTPQKAPPPYPGTPDLKQDLQKLTEIVVVPNSTEEVRSIVSSAVEIYFQQRRHGEPINGLEPPDSYFSNDEMKEDLEGNSKRVYKKLLFDLTGELMQEIYKDEQREECPPWRKPKQRRQKYFRGASPPSEVDTLKPIVQEAVIDMLGLNGSRKTDKNKWNVRKKKDHVDNILVQELREEEPEWINYDDDEVAVKMQLTENIFDTLLSDTVHVMNKIFRKRRTMLQN